MTMTLLTMMMMLSMMMVITFNRTETSGCVTSFLQHFREIDVRHILHILLHYLMDECAEGHKAIPHHKPAL